MMPAVIYIAYMMMCVGIAAAKDGHSTTISVGYYIVTQSLVVGLLYWGGFFDPLLQ